MPAGHTSDSNALISKIGQAFSNPCTCQSLSNQLKKLGCMKNSLSSIPTQPIARLLLLTLVACTFFSACAGHERRVERRQDRREHREERREDRQERRQDGPEPTPVPKTEQ